MEEFLDYINNVDWPLTIATLSTVAWGFCEVLARIPEVRANTTFQAIYNFLTGFKKVR